MAVTADGGARSILFDSILFVLWGSARFYLVSPAAFHHQYKTTRRDHLETWIAVYQYSDDPHLHCVIQDRLGIPLTSVWNWEQAVSGPKTHSSIQIRPKYYLLERRSWKQESPKSGWNCTANLEVLLEPDLQLDALVSCSS